MVLTIESTIDEITECSVKEHNVTRINSIKDKHGDLRQASKNVTFACTI
jgi:hypothetical protein